MIMAQAAHQFRVCVKCGHARRAGAFYPHRDQCKVCVLQKAKAYREANYQAVRARELAREQTLKYKQAKRLRKRVARTAGLNEGAGA